MGTWDFENWGIYSSLWGEDKYVILSHDESRGKFGERLKLATWNSRIISNIRKVFLANEMALELYADGFIKAYKLARSNSF